MKSTYLHLFLTSLKIEDKEYKIKYQPNMLMLWSDSAKLSYSHCLPCPY